MSMSQRVLVLVKPTTDAKCGVRLEGPGAVVTKVTPDSVAAAAGVVVGDRLVSVNGVPIDNFETGGRRLQQAAGKVELCVERGGQAPAGLPLPPPPPAALLASLGISAPLAAKRGRRPVG